ncbi:aspartic-type endopeptidase [Diplogelasinospora grovesii]|uniref:Aspartic-type endopeptidase n=1 Tax=Diplogelasinospora grovesii TaxID=303347 RepID=A0AAN6N4W4_9PEZI|nr:aspartic-type endopeptidase [Diplogelasinospora grovesii]
MLRDTWRGGLALALLLAGSFAAAYSRTDMQEFQLASPTHPWTATRVHRTTGNVQSIHGYRGSRTNSKSVAAILGAHHRRTASTGYENITTTTAYGTQYATVARWGNHSMMMLLDTGSADTWLVWRDFLCTDYYGSEIPQVACGFGPAFPGDFQYGYVTPQQHMYIQYGDGEVVTGPMGYADITVGNITVKRQEVCLANRTYWQGNNMTSGLMGLAWPALTNAYFGPSEPPEDEDHSVGNRVEYSPLFTSMVSQGLVPPVFSIAIDRNSSSGILAWGGIPPASGLDTSRIATMDMIITSLIPVPATASEYSFYTIIPDGWQYDQATDTKKYPYIMDSGTTLCYLPPSLAKAINQAFQPEAVYLWMYSAYFTSCNAIVPPIAVILNGFRFWLNPSDLIYRDMVDPITNLCMTAIASGGDGPYILGDVFMQNALVVFNVGAAQMQFIPREFY